MLKSYNEGRRRPSLIAAGSASVRFLRCGANEGRRRPSLIAAGSSRLIQTPPDAQRGAPAPLPHCGDEALKVLADLLDATRGAGAPPSLRHFRPGNEFPPTYPNEGRRRPSLIAATKSATSPSSTSSNEGRRRPSLIAANFSDATTATDAGNEGRRRPSLIAASVFMP